MTIKVLNAHQAEMYTCMYQSNQVLELNHKTSPNSYAVIFNFYLIIQ